MKLIKPIFALLIIATLVFICACTSTDSITEVMRSPDSYINKSVTVMGVMSKEMSGNADRFNYYLVEYHSTKLKLVCDDKNLIHNTKYVVNGTFLHNNETGQYYLKCTAPAVAQ
jgi:hypothetical protein